MSRIGKQPVQIPEGVDFKIEGRKVTVTGSLGTLSQEIRPEVIVTREGNTVSFSVASVDDANYWGLSRTLVENMIIGVTKGYSKQLEVVGIGYRVEVKNNYLVVFVGHSHDIWYEIPEGIKLEAKGMKVTVSGADKQKVGQATAVIRSFRKPEPYKGKGIKYVDEVIRRKAGKSGKK